MPFMIVLPMIFTVVCYWLVGFSTLDAYRFWVFYMWYVRLIPPSRPGPHPGHCPDWPCPAS